MRERLRISKTIEELDAAGREVPKEIDKKDNSLGSTKVGILDDYVFGPMANLLYFFEMVSTHPELQEVFENDIKDLLGVRRDNPSHDNYAVVFAEFLRSILLLKLYGRQERNDFRLRLLYILQDLIITGVNEYLPDILKDRQRYWMMLGDIERAAAWTSMIAYPVKDEYDLNDKERYKRDVENKSPHRVFPFLMDTEFLMHVEEKGKRKGRKGSVRK